MLSQPIQNLVELFLKFPGVGPRQATRFVFYLLREDRAVAQSLAEAISKLHDEVKVCSRCYKTFDGSTGSAQVAAPLLCELCRDPKRNQGAILVVEKEVDLENIERTRKYDGFYHVLGGTINPLDSSAPARLHIKELFERIQKLAAAGGELEVILATNPTTEGEATALYLERVLGPLKNQQPGLKLSRLGRGLSTGSELEYADDTTVANAILNRK